MRHLIAAASAALLLTFGGAASAATFIYTYSGTISAGSDAQGVFGAGGSDLAGEAFRVTFTLDDSLGTSSTGLIHSQVVGGSSFGTSSPVSVRVLVRGVEIMIDGSNWGQASATYSPDHQSAAQTAIGNASGAAGITTGSVQAAVHADGSDWLSSKDYRDVPSKGPTPGSYMGGSFYVLNGVNLPYAAQFYFDARLFEVNGVMPSSVPEPATWAMMIIGFGSAGSVLRLSRRRNQAIA